MIAQKKGSGGYTTGTRRLLVGFFLEGCYYLHQSRDALSPVCGIFTNAQVFIMNLNKFLKTKMAPKNTFFTGLFSHYISLSSDWFKTFLILQEALNQNPRMNIKSSENNPSYGKPITCHHLPVTCHLSPDHHSLQLNML